MEELLIECHGAIRAGEGRAELLYAEIGSTPGSIEAQQAAAVFTEAVSALPVATAELADESAAGTQEGENEEPPSDDPESFVLEPAAVSNVVSRARDRADQERRWADLPSLHLVEEPASSSWAAGPEVTSTSWERSEDRASTTEAMRLEPGDRFVVALIGVDGAVVGNDSLQINVFEFDVNATLDLAFVLKQEAVRTALAACAADPADPEKRQAAIETLRSSPRARQMDWGLDRERSHPIHQQTNESISWLGGVLVLAGCRGVQVGNHVKQHNTFTRVLSPRVSAQLLVDNPEVVESIVDFACGGDVSSRTLQERLAEAVCSSAREALERMPGSGQHALGNLTLAHEEAQIIGSRNRQTDSYDVTASIGRSAALAHEKQRLAREAETVRKAEAEYQRRLEEAREAELRAEAEIGRSWVAVPEVGRLHEGPVDIAEIERPAMRSPELGRIRMRM